MKNFKRYIIYHIKWQVGVVISWPCMWLMHDIWGWSNFWTIIGFQFVGALIFWNVDKLIFKNDRQIETEKENGIDNH
jgi:hypothetical protein